MSATPRGREPVVIVSGFPRCGSSLCCQMLEAGGVTVLGEGPAFEDMRQAGRFTARQAVMRDAGGGAVKWLDPHVFALPDMAPFKALVVLLRRNEKEQGRSTVKLLQMTGHRKPGRVWAALAKEVARENRRQYPRAKRLLERHGDVFELRFELLINEPAEASARLAAAVGPHLGRELDVEAMAATVIPRSPRSLTRLLEPDLIDRYDARKLGDR